jgi:glycosyltransferase involved in cell wall biosynthesis
MGLMIASSRSEAPSEASGHPSGGRPVSVLHLVGSSQDDGGILTVLRHARDPDGRFRHVVVVHRGFQAKRQPPLDLRESRWLLAESPKHLSLFARALGVVMETRRRCRAEHWDILHAHSRGGFAAAVLLALLPGKIPIVFTNHAFARRTGMYRWAAGRRRLATVVLNPAMATHYGLTPQPGHVEIIPDCCSDEFFEGPMVRPSGPRSRLALVGVGNLVRWKKWNLVLDALGRLPVPLRQRVHFTLWGPTPADADSQAFARELKGQVGALGLAPYVRLAGPTTRVREAVEGADVFIIPSTHEPCSVALTEALALGKPSIASASGGSVDLVKNGYNGRLFRPDDPEDLARQIAGLISGEGTTATPEQIRDSARHYSASVAWGRYHALYRRLLAEAPTD